MTLSVETLAEAAKEIVVGCCIPDDRTARELAITVLAAIMRSGYVIVPKEPDVQMLAAWYSQKNRGTQEIGETGDHTDDYSAYRAMIATAPKIQHSGGETA